MDDKEQDIEQTFGSVGEIAQLYLGNILYALEMTALSLEQQQKMADAAFYRGIAHKLAETHGKAKQQGGVGPIGGGK